MVNKILEVARGELGKHEYPPNSNNVIYNTHYYGGKVSGKQFDWCAVFIWDLFRMIGASDLYYGGKKTAYCPTLFSYHKSLGQEVQDNFLPGDIIFFNFNGGKSLQHVGICESYDGNLITTIDGNTGTSNEASGGSVMRRVRNKKYIVCAYRPNYKVIGKKKLEKRYNRFEELPEYAKAPVDRLIKAGRLNGSGAKKDKNNRPTDMDLSLDMIRLIVMFDQK